MDTAPGSHFHIYWVNTNGLDWQCFNTKAEARELALELALPGENFKIVELSTDCPLRLEKYRRDADR